MHPQNSKYKNSHRHYSHGLFIILRSLVLFTLLLPLFVRAQQGSDTLAALKQFIQISNSYEQLPMHAVIQIASSADFINSSRDTATMEMEFYLLQSGSYVKSGGMEQLSDDSLMVLVNSIAKKIIVLPNRQSVQDRLKVYMGIQLADSSLKKAAEKYTASVLPTENGNAAIEIKSRASAFGSPLPQESIPIIYNESTRQPLKVIQQREKLAMLDLLHYAALLQNPAYKGKLFTSKKRFFLIKGETITYSYQKIEYGNKVTLPALIKDRIVSNNSSGYTPAKGYEAFAIKKQNF